MKPILGILNAYDHRNRGDRAIIESQIAWLRSKIPDADFRIFSPAWEENAEVFGEDVSKPPAIRIFAEQGRVLNGILPLYECLMANFGLMQSPSGFDACDAYFLCGGGYLYSSASPLISRQLWMHVGNSLLAINSGKPVMQFPQSWGPIDKFADIWMCKQLAKKLPLICSRGEASTQLLSNWGFGPKTVEVPDIVLCMAQLRKDLIKRKERGNGELGISPIDFGFAIRRDEQQLSQYIDKLLEVSLSHMSSGGTGIVLFPQVQVTGMDEDLPVALELAKRLELKGVPYRLLEQAAWEVYFEEVACMSVFLGSRMHACIFAMISGVPTVGLSYQPKFEALFSQLDMGHCCFPINSFDPKIVSDTLSNLNCDVGSRQNMITATVMLSDRVFKGLDQCWEACGCANLWIDTPKFSIITPSLNQLEHLRRCAASVADQAGDFRFEHLIQDGGSGAEFDVWAAEQNFADVVCEPDGGMYDAINRGFLRANGDILAWLNCDEQYLPGTLEKVAAFFASNPDVDILFGDVVLVDEDGNPISYRQAVTPWVKHVESCFLPTYTAATFVRRKVIDDGVLLSSDYRMISDALWVIDLLKRGYKTAVMHEVLATFVQNGENMGQQVEGQREWCEWRNQRSGRVKQLFWSVMHRIRKLLLGAYRRRDLTIHIYTDNCDKRTQRVAQIGGRWRKK